VNGLVLDASVTLEWFLTEPDSSPAWDKVALLDEYTPVVPHIWQLEVANVLSMQVQRRGMPVDLARTVLAELLAVPIAVVDGGGPAAVMQLSIDQGLTSYDAAYLDVALRGGWPLVTFDRDLARAAHDMGVPVL
jgi:predicted nucleic acid-binding protein